MTAVAIETIRAQINVPLIAIEPAVKPAVAITQSKHIAVLATATTVKGKNLKSLIETYAQNIKVSLVPCIGLAEKIETGKAHTAEVKDYLKIFWRRWSSKKSIRLYWDAPTIRLLQIRFRKL